MPQKSLSTAYVAALWLVLGTPPALAASFRCGQDLIREGMSASDIREKCGEPDSVETVTEPVMSRTRDGLAYQVGVTTTDYWRYDRGSRRFPVRLTIKEGIAEKIELLSRNPRPGSSGR